MFGILSRKVDDLTEELAAMRGEIEGIKEARTAALDAHRQEIDRLDGQLGLAMRAIKAANVAIDQFVMHAEADLLSRHWFTADEQSDK